MRVWDIPIHLLCNTHLSGQHREIHGMLGSIKKYEQKGPSGYSNHPETKRWIDSKKQLSLIHDITSQEMIKRGMNHKSPFPQFQNDDKPLIIIECIASQIINIIFKSLDPNHKCNCEIYKLLKYSNDIKYKLFDSEYYNFDKNIWYKFLRENNFEQ